MPLEKFLSPSLYLINQLVGNANLVYFLNQVASDDGKSRLIEHYTHFRSPMIDGHPEQLPGIFANAAKIAET